MAITTSNVLSHCPNLNFSRNNHLPLKFSLSSFRPPSSSSSSSLRFLRISPKNSRGIICSAASAAGSSSSDDESNPYEVLGVSPIEGFDMIKAAYTKKRKDAERRGDGATAAMLERAYDKIMMAQLNKRKKGETYGSFKVAKDIKYADKQPMIPWGPRFSESGVKDMRINMAVSAVFIAWVFIQRQAEWKPIQFLGFVFVYRIFEKLKSFEAPVSTTFTEDGEDDKRGLRMGKRLLRSLFLVFSCIALASMAFTGVLNLIEYSGNYIPAALYNSQELIVTTVSAVMLYFMASYYR